MHYLATKALNERIDAGTQYVLDGLGAFSAEAEKGSGRTEAGISVVVEIVMASLYGQQYTDVLSGQGTDGFTAPGCP